MNRVLSLLLLMGLTFGLALSPSTSWADHHEKGEKKSESKTEDAKKDSWPTDKKSGDKDKKDAAKKDTDKTDADKEPAEKTQEQDEENAEKEADEAKAEDKKKEAKEDEEKKTKKKKRKTAKVETDSVKVDITVDGTFVAEKMTEVIIRPEAWSSFKIEEIVPHGSQVYEGEVLIKFDADKLKDAISDLELSQRLSELSLRKTEKELPRLEKSLELQLAAAEQSHERTHDDVRRYQEVDRERLIKSANMSMKMAKQRLDYAKDELEQLEKMYKADDLTEETEEIVLTRTRQQYEISKYYYERQQQYHEELMSIYLPRQDEDIKESLDKVDMSLERAEIASQLDLNKARYELQQKKISREKSLEKHAKLIEDKGLMEIESPAAGTVYYGRCTNGKWGDMSSMINKLVPHGSAPTGSVLMTIVDPEKMYLTGTVSEKQMPSLKKGQKAKIKLAAEGTNSLEGRVKEVSAVPISTGKFSLQVELTSDDHPEWLVPGMSSKMKINTYNKKDALVLPKKAVHAEEDDEDAHYVWVVENDDADSEAEKTKVKVGKTDGDNIEILDGVEKGDVVSLEDESKKDEDKD